jgi:hypothetical protein
MCGAVYECASGESSQCHLPKGHGIRHEGYMLGSRCHWESDQHYDSEYEQYLREQEMKIQEVHLPSGIWKIYINSKGECLIADAEGRKRHRSKGHTNTAIHLAMYIGATPFVPETNADEALREEVKEFLRDSEQQNEADIKWIFGK